MSELIGKSKPDIEITTGADGDEELDMGALAQALFGEDGPSPQVDNTDYISENIIKLNDISEDDLASLDVKEFNRGVKDMSRLCGQITALVNVGINPLKAMDYIVDKESSRDIMEQNAELAKLSLETQVQVAKYEQKHIKAQTI